MTSLSSSTPRTAAPSDPQRPLVTLRGIQKSFGPTHVLKGVNFTVRPGQIHALLGGNGAGKSTMIRVITGEIRANAGDLHMQASHGGDPKVAVVYQELALIPDLTVAENIALVHAPSGFALKRQAQAALISEEALSLIDPHLARTALFRKAGDLSMHEGQIVEIARALSTGAKVLLLDEPTANLTAAETEQLFAVLKGLAAEKGIGIVFVSHRMKEIRQLCDVCTIIRDGKTAIDARPIGMLTDAAIIQEMGQPAHRAEAQIARNSGQPVVATLTGPTIQHPIRRGTILGLAGAPEGPAHVISSLIGHGRHRDWCMAGDGWGNAPTSPRDAVAQGIGFVSGDRATKGVLAQLPIIDNVLASRRVRERRLFVGQQERAECAELMQALKVKAGSAWDRPGTLSGGNQQKLLVARWLGLPLKMVVFEEPTRGVDIGTKRDMYALIRQMAEEGTIVVWWSTENVELLELCHEILAFDTEGQPKGFLPADRFDEDALAELTGMAA